VTLVTIWSLSRPNYVQLDGLRLKYFRGVICSNRRGGVDLCTGDLQQCPFWEPDTQRQIRSYIYVHQRTQSNPDDLVIFYRTMLCICYTSHGPVSVRPSVRPSQVGVLLKRLNIGSHKQHHTIVRDSSFLKPKISAKFDRGHPLRGCQKQVGWVKIVDFRQITGYISKTAQDRRMVSIKVE